MTWFLQSIDLDVWDVIEDGPTFLTKLVDGVLVPSMWQWRNNIEALTDVIVKEKNGCFFENKKTTSVLD